MIPQRFVRTGERPGFVLLGAACSSLLMTIPAGAEECRLDLGLRLNAVGASGKPSNDIPGAGVFGRTCLNEQWRIGLYLDHSSTFDVERPYESLGLAGDSEVDAKGTSTAFTVTLERLYSRPESRLQWFWAAGGGFGVVDVDDARGTLVGGGTYDIQQEVDGEWLLTLSGGPRWLFGEDWSVEAALRLDWHMTDWTVVDRVSGASASIDDYLVRGVHVGVAYRF
jgi:hypothetical protein